MKEMRQNLRVRGNLLASGIVILLCNYSAFWLFDYLNNDYSDIIYNMSNMAGLFLVFSSLYNREDYGFLMYLINISRISFGVYVILWGSNYFINGIISDLIPNLINISGILISISWLCVRRFLA